MRHQLMSGHVGRGWPYFGSCQSEAAFISGYTASGSDFRLGYVGAEACLMSGHVGAGTGLKMVNVGVRLVLYRVM